MSEQTIMVCVRVSDALTGSVAEGSVITNCSECDAPIWISKASQDQLVEVNARPVCTKCFKPTEDSILNPPSKEMIKEIIKHLHENPTNRIRGTTTE